MTAFHDDPFDFVHDATRRLVAKRSVSPSREEMDAVREALNILTEGAPADRFAEVGVEPIPGDPWQRGNGYAVLIGESRRTIVLFGHIDTVDTADFGAFESLALDPTALEAAPAFLSSIPDLETDLAAAPEDWMFGRGVADMKAGVAAILAVTRELAAGKSPPLSLVLLVTPDEENESAGVLAALNLLVALRARHDLEYVGAINAEYTMELYPGDPHRYVYTGVVGKLLPSFFIVGEPAHAGEPFAGLDANLLLAELIRDLDLNVDLCDEVPDLRTAPPVTLHAGDLKDRYDTQLPYAASLALNVVTLTTGPDMLLERLRSIAAAAMSCVLERVSTREAAWRGDGPPARRREGNVFSYQDLAEQVAVRLGAAARAEIARAWESAPPQGDRRDRCLRVVQCLWELSGLPAPAIVLYYAPPYYPHGTSPPGPLLWAVDEVVAAHPELNLISLPYFPLFADTSYLRLDSGIEIEALIANMPGWREGLPGAYSLPVGAMRSLDIPVIVLGPYGRAVHQRGERVLMSYSFRTVPGLIHEVIRRVAAL